MQDIDLFSQEVNNMEEEPTCSICLEYMQDISAIHKIEECGHSFHNNCLITWLRSGNIDCPNCRSRSINNRHTQTNIFKLITSFARRKSAPKNLISLVNKYKLAKKKSIESNKEYTMHKRENKNTFKQNKILRDRKWKFYRLVSKLRREITNLPIKPIIIPIKK